MGGVTILWMLAFLVKLTFHDTLPESSFKILNLHSGNLRALTNNVYIMYTAVCVHVFGSH